MRFEFNTHGGIPERPKGADCKSVVHSLRWSESTFPHPKKALSKDKVFFQLSVPQAEREVCFASETQYAHGKADFIAKLQIALKEATETGYWLELLYKTNYIDENEYKTLDSTCTSIRVILISSINTAKENNHA